MPIKNETKNKEKKKRRGLKLQKILTVGFHSAAAVLFCNSAINALCTC